MDKEDGTKNKVHYDPGWNDPPLYSYDSMNAAGQSNPTKKVNILNKRVAYPMGQPKPMPDGMNPTLPPSNSAVPLPPTSIPNTEDVMSKQVPKSEEETQTDKEEALSRIKETFKQVLEDNAADMQQGADEINRRLLNMYKMWEEDRLNVSIHRRLMELAEALKANDLDRADHLHVGLAVDHPSLCNSWIPGVRRMVMHLKSSKQVSSNPETGVSEPIPHE